MDFLINMTITTTVTAISVVEILVNNITHLWLT